MNKNKKNNKKVLLVLGIVIVIIIGVLIISFNKTNNMSCEFSYNNLRFSLDVFYSKKTSVDRLDGIVEYDTKNQKLDDSVENLVSMLNSYYDNLIVGDSIDVDVYNEGDIIFIKYNIDYKNSDPNDIKKLGFIDNEDLSTPSIDSFRDSIEKSGGVCVEK